MAGSEQWRRRCGVERARSCRTRPRGRLLKLDPIRPTALHLTVPPTAGVRSDRLRIHRAEVTARDRIEVDGIPCTSATRTLIDCAALLDGEALETAFELARRMGLTSTNAVRSRLGRGRPGSALMRDVLRHAQERPKESRLEVEARAICCAVRKCRTRSRSSSSGLPRRLRVAVRFGRSANAMGSNGTVTGCSGSGIVDASRRSKRPAGGSCTSRGRT